jgi:hypothetical protein
MKRTFIPRAAGASAAWSAWIGSTTARRIGSIFMGVDS